MAVFVKADLNKEKEALQKLVFENADAKRVYDEFQVEIAFQQCPVQKDKSKNFG